MDLYVDRGDGGAPLAVQVEACATVADVIAALRQVSDSAPVHIVLRYQGEDLDPAAALADLGVCSEAVLHVADSVERINWRFVGAEGDGQCGTNPGPGYSMLLVDGQIPLGGVGAFCVQMEAPNDACHDVGAVTAQWKPDEWGTGFDRGMLGYKEGGAFDAPRIDGPHETVTCRIDGRRKIAEWWYLDKSAEIWSDDSTDRHIQRPLTEEDFPCTLAVQCYNHEGTPAGAAHFHLRTPSSLPPLPPV
eukprot:TRINITY_DN9774_c0_g1_i3.p1 TRINITY_DN9774_c0_g1~~TRINITY_DN9774_c0_g1_i3.p1  ORF type:complete len:247 (+),score=28.69 TRINITY_DN9774_c0_g1_i3:78-818(+)